MDLSLTEDERAERLADLAAAWPDVPGPVTDLCLREWAHPALTVEEQREHLEELAAKVTDLAHLAAGVTDWTAIEPELTCRFRNEAAEQIACERLDDALHPLVFGPARQIGVAA